jgi:signal transduction histidine kinase
MGPCPRLARITSCVFCLLLVLCAAAQADAAPTLVLSNNGYVPLLPYVEVYAERGDTLDITDVRSRPFGPPGALFHETKTTYWLRFRYHSLTSQQFFVFLGYKPSYADLYVEAGGKPMYHVRSGAKVPFNRRPVRDFGVIELPLPPAPTTQTAYLRIQSFEPSTALSIESSSLMVTADTGVSAFAVALSSVLTMLLLMSLVLVAMLHRPVYVYYSLYLLCQVLYRLNDSGIASAVLWPNASFSWMQGDVFFDGITLVAATLFLRAFLDLRRYSRVLDAINVAVAAVGALYAIGGIFDLPIRVTLVWDFAFIYAPLWCITTAYCWKRGHAQARFLLMAWSALLLGQLLLDAKNLGFAPHNLTALFFFSYGPYVGLMLECMLITMVLAFDAQREYSTQLEGQVAKRTRELDDALRKMAAANRDLETFGYAVSHDLRTPLRAISGFAGVMAEDYASALDGQGARYIQRISAAAARMTEMIEALLSLAGVSRAQFNPEPLDMSRLVRDLLEELMITYGDRDVELVVAEGIRGFGDRRLIGNLLQNLLANALKFSRRQPHARVEFGTLTGVTETVYFVRDNGAGFDMTGAQKLFGAFQRLHTQDEFEGTGIGLATAQRIVYRHGGKIWAQSEPGKGATFYFTLDARSDRTATAAAS